MSVGRKTFRGILMKILFASNNRDKWLELVDYFKEEGVELVMADKHLELDEEGCNLIENSALKAIAAARQTGMLSLGDDSGVYVKSLDYFPGVYSRRWLLGTDNDRNLKLLKMMKNIKDRDAFLISRFTLADPTGNVLFTTIVENNFRIANDIYGKNGFGYDPILIPTDKMINDLLNSSYDKTVWPDELVKNLNKMTIAELTQIQKNQLNNRGRIAKPICDFLKTIRV